MVGNVVGYSVFKRKRRGKDGKVQVAKRYTIELRFPDGRTRSVAGFSDKAATVQKANKLVRNHERKEVGLHDQFGDHRKRPLAEHLVDFLTSMRNGTLSRRRGRPTEAWVTTCERRIRALFDLMEVTRVDQLELSTAEKILDRRVREGWSAKTRDDHAHLLRQFGNWLVDDSRWSANPFHRLGSISNDSTKTFKREALDLDQISKLIEAAEVRSVQNYAKSNRHASPEYVEKIRRRGWERGLVYEVAAYTGLRRGEITKITWGDLTLGEQPKIELPPIITKNKKGGRLEMPYWFGERLSELRKHRSIQIGRMPAATDPIFTSSYRHLTERLKEDAVFAKIGKWDETKSRVWTEGLVIDFHALRGTYVTLIAESGMSLQSLRDQARHSSLKITMDVYAKARRQMIRGEVDALPRPSSGSVHRPVKSLPSAAQSCPERVNTSTNRRAGS